MVSQSTSHPSPSIQPHSHFRPCYLHYSFPKHKKREMKKRKPILKRTDSKAHSIIAARSIHPVRARAGSPFMSRPTAELVVEKKTHVSSPPQPWLANPREWPGVPNFMGAVTLLKRKAIKQSMSVFGCFNRYFKDRAEHARASVVGRV